MQAIDVIFLSVHIVKEFISSILGHTDDLHFQGNFTFVVRYLYLTIIKSETPSQRNRFARVVEIQQRRNQHRMIV